MISVRVPRRLKEELKTSIGRIKGDLAIPFIRVVGMPTRKKQPVCNMVRITWRFLVGTAFVLSVVSVTAWGDIAEDLWLLVRVVGFVALVVAWAGLWYEYTECDTGYDGVLLVVSGVLSLLLGLTYVFVGDIDEYGVEPLRYFVFSTFTHGLLLLLPSRRG
ncbi:MAG: hypothetical protein ACTSYM_09965 [Candidatus Baldrarchaeia archaeon]